MMPSKRLVLALPGELESASNRYAIVIASTFSVRKMDSEVLCSHRPQTLGAIYNLIQRFMWSKTVSLTKRSNKLQLLRFNLRRNRIGVLENKTGTEAARDRLNGLR